MWHRDAGDQRKSVDNFVPIDIGFISARTGAKATSLIKGHGVLARVCIRRCYYRCTVANYLLALLAADADPMQRQSIDWYSTLR